MVTDSARWRAMALLSGRSRLGNNHPPAARHGQGLAGVRWWLAAAPALRQFWRQLGAARGRLGQFWRQIGATRGALFCTFAAGLNAILDTKKEG